MLYRRDAWIYAQKSTEHGREFLKNLHELTQINADINAIKRRSQLDGKGGI